PLIDHLEHDLVLPLSVSIANARVFTAGRSRLGIVEVLGDNGTRSRIAPGEEVIDQYIRRAAGQCPPCGGHRCRRPNACSAMPGALAYSSHPRSCAYRFSCGLLVDGICASVSFGTNTRYCRTDTVIRCSPHHIVDVVADECDRLCWNVVVTPHV